MVRMRPWHPPAWRRFFQIALLVLTAASTIVLSGCPVPPGDECKTCGGNTCTHDISNEIYDCQMKDRRSGSTDEVDVNANSEDEAKGCAQKSAQQRGENNRDVTCVPNGNGSRSSSSSSQSGPPPCTTCDNEACSSTTQSYTFVPIQTGTGCAGQALGAKANSEAKAQACLQSPNTELVDPQTVQTYYFAVYQPLSTGGYSCGTQTSSSTSSNEAETCALSQTCSGCKADDITDNVVDSTTGVVDNTALSEWCQTHPNP